MKTKTQCNKVINGVSPFVLPSGFLSKNPRMQGKNTLQGFLTRQTRVYTKNTAT